MKRPVIVAGVLAYNEAPELVAAALASCDELDNAFVFGEDVVIDSELAEAAARQRGIDFARDELAADWYLQVDADERLVNGELLFKLLPVTPGPAYPLPYVQVDFGWTTLAPCKCVRVAGCELVLGSDVYTWDAFETPLVCSGYSFPPELEPLLERLPHLLHKPSERPDAGARRRLSEAIEGTDRSLRFDCAKLELPFLVPRALQSAALFPRP